MKAAESPKAAPLNHIPALDGLRGIAVLVVLAHHFRNGIPLGWLHELSKPGWVGVDLFFVLSGFLITRILRNINHDWGNIVAFYIRRVLRLFPLYYGLLILVFLILPWFIDYNNPPLHKVERNQIFLWLHASNLWMAYTRDWSQFHQAWLNLGCFWTLSLEEHFYLIWPWFVFRWNRARLIALCVFVQIAALGLRYVEVMVWGNMVAACVSTPCRVDSISIGCLIALMMENPATETALLRAARTGLIGTGLGLAAIIWVQGQYEANNFLVAVPGFSLLDWFFGFMMICSLQAGWLKRLMENRSLRSIGKYSYGIYIYQSFTHPIAWVAYRAIAPLGVLAQVLGFVVDVLLTWAVAAVSWHLYEARFLALKRTAEYGARRGTPEREKDSAT